MSAIRSCIEFGRALIATGDLDPMYILLNRAQDSGAMTPLDARRWVMVQLLFYSSGASFDLYEDRLDWWAALQAETRRGPERRYFRSIRSSDALAWFQGQHIDGAHSVSSITARDIEGVCSQVKAWPQFGELWAWKAADFLETSLGVPIVFDNTLRTKEPLKALEILISAGHQKALEQLLDSFSSVKAPHCGIDRFCNIQEVETILCKWKGSVNGTYSVGKDIDAARRSLKPQWAKLL